MSLTPAEVGGSESGQVRGGTQSLALTLPPGHLPQSGPQSKETQARGKGQLESGALGKGWLTPVCVHACTLSLSHTHTTQTQACAHTHTHKLAFRDGSEGRESEGTAEGQGKLSLWLVTQSLWNNPSALS